QLVLAHAGNAPVAPQPKAALAVFPDLRDGVVRQPFPRGKGGKLPAAPPAQTAARGADPERALGIQTKRANPIAQQPAALLEMGVRLILVAIQTVPFGANPQGSIAVMQDGRDGMRLRIISLFQPVPLPLPPNLSLSRAGPHRALPVFGQRDDVQPRQRRYFHL